MERQGLTGSCSSQSNLLQSQGESYIIPSPLFSILWTLLPFRVPLGSQQPALNSRGNHHRVWISRGVFAQSSVLQQEAVLACTLTPNVARDIHLLQLAQLPKKGPSLEQGPTGKSHSPPLLLPCMQGLKEEVIKPGWYLSPKSPILIFKSTNVSVLHFLFSSPPSCGLQLRDAPYGLIPVPSSSFSMQVESS